jgi:hypothetical protein
VLSGGCDQIVAVEFLQELAHADTFWSTAALGQLTLMIALTVEARAAQEDFESKCARLEIERQHWIAALQAASHRPNVLPSPLHHRSSRRIPNLEIQGPAGALLTSASLLAL